MDKKSLLWRDPEEKAQFNKVFSGIFSPFYQID